MTRMKKRWLLYGSRASCVWWWIVHPRDWDRMTLEELESALVGLNKASPRSR